MLISQMIKLQFYEANTIWAPVILTVPLPAGLQLWFLYFSLLCQFRGLFPRLQAAMPKPSTSALRSISPSAGSPCGLQVMGTGFKRERMTLSNGSRTEWMQSLTHLCFTSGCLIQAAHRSAGRLCVCHRWYTQP